MHPIKEISLDAAKNDFRYWVDPLFIHTKTDDAVNEENPDKAILRWEQL